MKIRKIKNFRVLINFFTLFVIGLVFALPSVVHAETIQSTLVTNSSIKDIWNTILFVANIPIIIVVVVVAFAEILRLKIDTYGFKKVLPTLLLAIIAAQFSYLVCKLIIDVANMIMTLFTDNRVLSQLAVASGNNYKGAILTGLKASITKIIPAPNFSDYTTIMTDFEAGFKILVYLILSVLVLIMALMFIVRIYTVYFLVIVSPAAFMALSLPQTKTYFTRWWDLFFKWTFMPVVSVFFLWIAAVYNAHPIKTGSIDSFITSSIVTIACFYFAITVPYKMGGAIMALAGKYPIMGAKLRAKKVQQKWIDPNIKSMKDKASRWYYSQSGKKLGEEGANWFNTTVGAAARKSQRNEKIRAAEARAVEGAKNSAQREAFGGKHDQFMSVEEQAKWGKYFDDIESDFGEWEWKQKDLEAKYRQTKEGQAATDRSTQYKLRMQATESELKNEHSKSMTKAYSRDQSFMEGDNGHYGRMLEKALNAQSDSFALEAAEKKSLADSFQTLEGNAYLLDIALQGIKDWQETFDQLAKEATTKTDPDEKAVIQAQMDEAQKYIDQNIADYNTTITKLYEKNYDKGKKQWKGRSHSFSRMVTNDEDGSLRGIKTDADGNIISIDYKQARTLADVNGLSEFVVDSDGNFVLDSEGRKIKNDSYSMFNDRRTKRLSIISKEELASTAGKRTAEGSIEEIETHPGTYGEAIRKLIITNKPSGLTEGEVRKTTAEIANIMNGSGDINSSSFSNNHSWLVGQFAAVAAENNEDGTIARNRLAEMTKATMTKLGNVSQLTNTARSELEKDYREAAQTALETEKATRAAAGSAPMSDDEAKKFVENKYKTDVEALSMDNARYSKELADKIRGRMREELKISTMPPNLQEMWDKRLNVEFDENGQFQVDLKLDVANDKDAQDLSNFMKNTLTTTLNAAYRSALGEAKSGYVSAARNIVTAGKIETGRDKEDFGGYDQIKQKLAKAKKDAEAKIAEEKKKMSGGGTTP